MGFDLLRRFAPYIIAVAIAAGAAYGCYRHGVSTERADWETRWAERDTADAEARAAAELTQRTEEQRRQDWAAGVQRDAIQETERLRASGDGLDADNRRLREQLAGLQARLGGARPGADTPVSSASATRAAMVLSDLYGSCQGRLSELSKTFDRNRVAALACERFVEGLRPSDKRTAGVQ